MSACPSSSECYQSWTLKNVHAKIVEQHKAKKGALCALFDTSIKFSTQLVLLVTLNF